MVTQQNDDRPVALVAGSRGGIGRAIVKRLRRGGWRTVGFDISAGTSEEELVVDVTDAVACRSAVDNAVRATGRLDAVVCAAGVNMRARIEETDIEKARALFDINVWGTFQLLDAARPHLVRSAQSAVAVITSTSGNLGFAGSSVYAMSKMALTGLVRSLAVEWADEDIRVNAVAPAIVPTEMNADVRAVPGYTEKKLAAIPLGRFVEPDEVAKVIEFVISEQSTAITGQVLFVDGGASIKG